MMGRNQFYVLRNMSYTFAMIRSFEDKSTAALFVGLAPQRLPVEIRKRARENMNMLHIAVRLDDLLAPPRWR